jgi:hypothetical protein
VILPILLKAFFSDQGAYLKSVVYGILAIKSILFLTMFFIWQQYIIRQMRPFMQKHQIECEPTASCNPDTQNT